MPQHIVDVLAQTLVFVFHGVGFIHAGKSGLILTPWSGPYHMENSKRYARFMRIGGTMIILGSVALCVGRLVSGQ